MGLEALFAFCGGPVEGSGRRRAKSISEFDILDDINDVATECPSVSGRLSSRGSTVSGSHHHLTKGDINSLMGEVAAGVQPWLSGSFTLVQKLQDAPGNFGEVSCMQQSEELGGAKVAVKRMPNHWMCHSAAEFQERNPKVAERPWCDLAILKQLNKSRFPYVCELLGVYRDSTNTYVVTSLASEGDLFTWCKEEPTPGLAREKIMLPLVTQIASAVRWLHELGIAHRDLSLENILLTGKGDDMKVQLIDFGMATVARTCRGEVRGKVAYRAPEMHLEAPFDAFLADAFSLGVVIFAMAACDYPWQSTKKGNCRFFEYIDKFGFRAFVSKRKLRGSSGQYLGEVFSPNLVDVLEGALQFAPEKRLTLGEDGFHQDRPSIWTKRWITHCHEG